MCKRNWPKYIWLQWVGNLLKIPIFDSSDRVQVAAQIVIIKKRERKKNVYKLKQSRKKEKCENQTKRGNNKSQIQAHKLCQNCVRRTTLEIVTIILCKWCGNASGDFLAWQKINEHNF